MRLARAYAIYRLCAENHSGQWSRGYRLLCRTGQYMRRRFGIARPLDQVQLTRPEFRREVAAELRRFRHLRRYL